MIGILRFIALPATIILAMVWWLVLKHSRSSLVSFLAVVGALLLLLRLAGLSPLAFFVSAGGYVWFIVLAWIAAVLVRAIRGVPS
jgi:hypothetical protein